MRKPLLLFCIFLFLFTGAPAFANPVDSLKGRIVVVDPGHGGFDPGTVRGGVYEKHVNLNIALKLKKSIEEQGATVILTRNSDYNLAVPGLHKREAHRYDLGKRLEIAVQSKADLFVSIHVNSINITNCRGAEVFYEPKSVKGKLLAECIQDELRSIPGMEKRMVKPSNYFVLSKATIPSALVEVGYLSNPRERNNLLNSDYQTMLAEKISCGIQKFLSQSNKNQ